MLVLDFCLNALLSNAMVIAFMCDFLQRLIINFPQKNVVECQQNHFIKVSR